MRNQRLCAGLHVEYPAQVQQVVVDIRKCGFSARHYLRAGLGQFIGLNTQWGQALRRDVATHPHAIVPAGKIEVGVGIEQCFQRGVFAGQLGQVAKVAQQGLIRFVPAGDAAVADHV
ncbi:hypothetical protein ALO63_200091 [Pseudomonas amygdali pv. mori]|uniref:ATPase AAA n=1 Tax=Pseudomonas amygdali pv. mori TaxID=34065 RepID=A0A0P9VPG7_PSEA0|nr:hypothetical protein ALO63_200091 [Pseudomonas amygdali pv. mori]